MEEKKETTKLSYEQLEQIANQLSQQNNQLLGKLQELNMMNVFKRLDYLFKILEYPMFFAESFVDKCSKEIEDIMTLKEESTDSVETQDPQESIEDYPNQTD